ncbi:FecR family protein [Paenibacillus daejeonensis]|uniref:FecR family protein n=1 Tax=Paenibacillus daejeonensis TaxID=135193 RepID=UPI000381720B|nr:FecR family protein [Paenibacillus daejeonensis]
MRRASYGLRLLLAIVLVAGPLSFLFAPDEALAQIKRVALVKDLKGTVNVKKSGGSKAFAAFKNMTLNEGDTVTTSKGARVVLELSSSKAERDSVTIGENSQVTFTKLKDDKGTKTKMNIWAGSLWVKVKSITNASDQFELETPTAIMGVRGTHFLVVVEPKTGITTLASLSGIVTGKHTSKQSDSAVYPSQQIVLLPDEEPGELVTVVNFQELISQLGKDIIEEIIRSADDIRRENDLMIERIKQQLPNGTPLPAFLESADDIDRVAGNLDRLVGNLLKEAIDQNKMSKEEAIKLVGEVNPGLPTKNKINLDDPADHKKTTKELEKEKKVQEKKKQAEEKINKEKAKQQEDRDKQSELIKKLEEKKKLQEEANQRALEEAKKKAEDAYKAKLSELERQKFEQEKKKRQEELADNQTQPQPTSPVTPPNPPAAAQPTARLVLDPAHNGSVQGTAFTVNLELNGFTGSRAIYALQVRLAYDDEAIRIHEQALQGANGLTYRTGGGLFRINPGNSSSSAYDSVDEYNRFDNGFFYSLMKYRGQSAVIGSPTTLVKLPFLVGSATGQETIRIAEFIAVDAAGNPITGIQISNLTVTLPSP